MRFYTIEYDQKESVAVESEHGRLCRLSGMGIDVADMNHLICEYDELCGKIQDCLMRNAGERLDAKAVKVLAPILVPGQDIICLGVNYREHIEETKDALDFTKKTDAVYFSKRVNRCNDPGGVIPMYDFVDSLDYEVELGVILGKDAFQVSAEMPRTIFLAIPLSMM